MSKYAISDIHGCLKTFEAMLDKIALSQSDTLMLLGDYVDRGPDSKGVLDLIMKLENQGYQINCLFGNHEQEMINARTNYESKHHWKKWGGVQTMESFNVTEPIDIPTKYVDFLQCLPRYIEFDGFIFCHAGLNFDMPNPLEAEESLLWIRNWYQDINYKWLGNRIVVHGHTPTDKYDIETMLQLLDKEQYIDIDCGCFRSNKSTHQGYLCCFDFENRALHFQKCLDKVTF
jgi:serine/threonine protein phosphatase 1